MNISDHGRKWSSWHHGQSLRQRFEWINHIHFYTDLYIVDYFLDLLQYPMLKRINVRPSQKSNMLHSNLELSSLWVLWRSILYAMPIIRGLSIKKEIQFTSKLLYLIYLYNTRLSHPVRSQRILREKKNVSSVKVWTCRTKMGFVRL